MGYLELKKLLQPERPNLGELERFLKKMPTLKKLDLLALRYRVNRICTLFEPEPDIESSYNEDTDFAIEEQP